MNYTTQNYMNNHGNSNYMVNPNTYSTTYSSNPVTYGSDDRFIGGFAFPFLLGGVTGAALAPNFWRPPYNRPYPIYGPCPNCYPYRPF